MNDIIEEYYNNFNFPSVDKLYKLLKEIQLYPNIKLISEIHPDHIDNELTATHAIREVMKKNNNDAYILENYLEDDDNSKLSLK